MFGRKCDLGASMTLESSFGYLKEGKKNTEDESEREREPKAKEREEIGVPWVL